MTLTLNRCPAAIKVSLWEDPERHEVEPIRFDGPSDRRGNRDVATVRALVRLFDLPPGARAWPGSLTFVVADDGRVGNAMRDRRGYCRQVLAVGAEGYARCVGSVVVEEL